MIALLALALSLTAPTAPRLKPAAISSIAAGACAAVTRADVESALGRSVNSGVEEAGRRTSSCDYSRGNGLISITVQRLEADVDLEVEVKSLERALPGAKARITEEFGLPAFFLDLGDSGTQVHVLRSGGQHLMITILGFGAPPDVSLLAGELVRTALARISVYATSVAGPDRP